MNYCIFLYFQMTEMNVVPALIITVTLTLNVPTLLGASPVLVTRDTLAMELVVLV